ncbi:hypothetical protein BT96DRAFT_999592 [Gymnopus androsaceus JB14]|uniref:Uncharacterized protein n=1 Tax=Gymnopus androsaceus JB14 TaxID=1447944 RepID=A0A6A4H6E0_9AGAR|nr:hypothetical protein BT96DRAFT_999592 [Gymnopus androsaceus JB14]
MKKRASKSRKIVAANGMTFVVDSDPEIVHQPLQTNIQPLSDRKKKIKKEKLLEDHCNVCWDGGELYLSTHESISRWQWDRWLNLVYQPGMSRS